MLLPRKIGVLSNVFTILKVYNTPMSISGSIRLSYSYFLSISRLPVTNNIHQNIRSFRTSFMRNNIPFSLFSHVSAPTISIYLLSLVIERYRHKPI